LSPWRRRASPKTLPRYPQGVSEHPATAEVFALMSWRNSAIGIYRFWRDLGYAIGGLGLGLAASLTGLAEAALWFVAGSMVLSGGLLFWLCEETHPRLNPADPPEPAEA